MTGTSGSVPLLLTQVNDPPDAVPRQMCGVPYPAIATITVLGLPGSAEMSQIQRAGRGAA